MARISAPGKRISLEIWDPVPTSGSWDSAFAHMDIRSFTVNWRSGDI
jgi:hypothetical protein